MKMTCDICGKPLNIKEDLWWKDPDNGELICDDCFESARPKHFNDTKEYTEEDDD